MPRPRHELDQLVATVVRCGGIAHARTLSAAASPHLLRRAVRDGVLSSPRRGWYVLAGDAATERIPPGAGPGQPAATDPESRPDLAGADLQATVRAGGTLSHLSAARVWGWPLLVEPDAVHVTVVEGRRVSARQGRGLVVHRRATDSGLPRDITTPLETVLDVARTAPWPEALAVADSALRSGLVGAAELREAADLGRGPGCRRARRVAGAASPLAAGPFESAVRAAALDVPGLDVVPQYRITDGDVGAPGRFDVRVDLADPALRIVIEADSHAWHSTPAQRRRDSRRYVRLTCLGWLVLSVVYDDVVADRAQLLLRLTEAVDLRRRNLEAEAALHARLA
ncbi:hypothetical protein [Agilicoccus flavus]|uniref:hypothetical protein n=1 Tax=Agilicoccus flavus TaxID=2775968 RepID=UPI001CF718D1|nr:hypothetical protein [Agilicoccus flavus]